MAESKSVVIKLTNEQREAIRKATGQNIGELKVEALEGRVTPWALEERKAPYGGDLNEARKAPFGGGEGSRLSEARKAPFGGDPAANEARKAPFGGDPAANEARKAPFGGDPDNVE